MPLPERILIIGCGFIGSALARAALQDGIHVRILTRSLPSILPVGLRAQADLRIADAADPGSVAAALSGVEHVIYAAGDLRAGISVSDPAQNLLNELRPLLQTLEACAQQPSLGFTFLSSGGTVYGNAPVVPTPEESPTDPLVSYGILKLVCEKYVLLYSSLHGVGVRIVRCANAYGEGQPVDRPQGIIGVALHRVAHGLPITVYGDGSIVRDYVHIDDIASAVLALCAAPPEPKVINLGSGVGTSLNELLALIATVTNRETQIERRPARAFDLQVNVLDITKLASLLDFCPIPLERGIRSSWRRMTLGDECTACGPA